MLGGEIGAVDMFAEFQDILEGMKDAFMVKGGGKNVSNDGAIILAEIGDDDIRMVAFGAEGEQESARARPPGWLADRWCSGDSCPGLVDHNAPGAGCAGRS